MPLELTRRRVITSGLALATTLQLQRASLALGMAPQADVCRLSAEQEVGPYYIADELLRSNIVEDRVGIPLTLKLMVLDSRTCKPLANAAVDVWHCDALGLYAGFTKMSPRGPGGPDGPGGPEGHDGHGGPPPRYDPEHPGNRPGPPEGFGPPPRNEPTDKLTFLRGIQITGSDGSVTFRTVFPGFYMGRTNHVHFKVRVGGHAAPQGSGKTYAAGHTSHVGQVFFPEDVTAELMKHPPYSRHQIHRTTQAEDGIYGGQHGDLFVATLVPEHPGHFAAGMHANLITAVDPAATPAPVQGGPGGRRPPPRR